MECKKNNRMSPGHGWLDPEGEFHPCKYGLHDRTAECKHLDPGEYEEKMCNPKGGPNNWYSTPTQILERKGWIKIQMRRPCEPDHVRIGEEWFVTKPQYQFIIQYLTFHELSPAYIGDLNLRIKGK